MKPEIHQFLKEANLTEENKTAIKFFVEAVEGELNEFTDKSFLFEGSPGIGKTYFVEHLLKLLDFPILFMGPFKFDHPKAKHFKTMKELTKEFYKIDKGIVYIDDLQNSFKFERDGMGEWLTDDERKLFLGMLEHIKRSKQKKFLFITLNDDGSLEEPWLDRIETHIELDEPKEKSKKIFLAKKYPKYLKSLLINEIAEKSIGYNFRNLDELIKIAYRGGEGRITKKSIKKALSTYTPTSLTSYDIIHKTDVRFKDIIGNEKLKKELGYLKTYIKHPRFFLKSGIERSNVLIFNGPPGTGKTFMARALAGELNLPLINIDSLKMHGRSALVGVNSVARLGRRFRNCIIFVDDVDKMIGQEILSEDREVIGGFESELDGVREKTKAIIILSMNNRGRFGSAFHDRIPCFNFNYPKENERRIFLEDKIKKSELPFSKEAVERMVGETKNTSYRQMGKVWNAILFKLMEKPEISMKNNKLIASEIQINEAVEEVMGFVSKATPIMIG